MQQNQLAPFHKPSCRWLEEAAKSEAAAAASQSKEQEEAQEAKRVLQVRASNPWLLLSNDFRAGS